jgi:hypothetical protein
VLAADTGSGAIAVNRTGSRILVTHDGRDDEHRSVWVLGAKLGVRRAGIGPCLPAGAAASFAGPTKGRFYVTDSGICTQARLWQVRP